MDKQIFLKKLTLKNFKGIKELNIDFSKNTNIFGENGTGKTTIADAFMWLLFDKDSQDRATFEIKTLDNNNNVLHGLEHEVTGVLEVDSKDIKLTKIYKEKWTKQRGEAEKTLTGHETLYSIDEVPVKKKEYQEKVNSLIEENIFKLITNPLYFSINMKWQDRRKALLDIIGDVTADRIINYKTNLKPLGELLEDKDIDTLKNGVQASKKKLNDKIKAIPIRIDETNNSIQEHDFDALEFRKRVIVTGIKSLEEKMLDSSKVNDELLREKDRLYELKNKLKDIEYVAKLKAEKPFIQLNEDLRKIKFEISSKESELVYKERELSKIKADIEKHEKYKDELKKKWYETNEKQFQFDESSCVCPTCKRSYETEDIQKTRQEMLENFNQNKASNLASITKEGQKGNKFIEELKSEINEINLDVLKTEISTLKDKQKELEFKHFNFEPQLDLESNTEYQEIKSQIEELKSKLQQPQVNYEIEEFKTKKKELEIELEEVNAKLAYKEQNEKLKARITELMDEERELAKQIAALEGQEFLCEEFIKTKVELLENSINSKFKYVTFKLFDTQVNGGLVETCEALINGVPFGNANTASQINAGLDIINALSNHYGVQAPIFIDNRESVNTLIETDSQIINLIVSKDKKLRVEDM
ncbi:DUF2813 domain-containing protein [uncultured Clostridium sp.]|uniref:DUF2813 domain-containing protein n=1 Tax=uncultured Clostridium sp. TaxID=59620 RepID=UPI0028E85821|nr:AAA family ATPase [uncultured Clostridium sp.]